MTLIDTLYNQVIIPEAVRNELSNASPENINIRAVVALSWIEIRLVKNTALVKTLLHDRELDRGEAEAIAPTIFQFHLIHKKCDFQFNIIVKTIMPLHCSEPYYLCTHNGNTTSVQKLIQVEAL